MCLCQLGDLMHINVFKFHFCYRLFSQYIWETAVHLKHYRYFLLLTTAAATKTTITTTKSTTTTMTMHVPEIFLTHFLAQKTRMSMPTSEHCPVD